MKKSEGKGQSTKSIGTANLRNSVQFVKFGCKEGLWSRDGGPLNVLEVSVRV